MNLTTTANRHAKLIKATLAPILPHWINCQIHGIVGSQVVLTDSLQFARTRKSSLERLEEFLPHAAKYAKLRNNVTSAHLHVSRLSPAIRHRLVTEVEVIERTFASYSLGRVEKFVQEVAWRLYWKGWLSLRPHIWRDYCNALAQPQPQETIERVQSIEAGHAAVDVMGYFARQLVETGYLHNHARMWFAGWWIHVEQLPWHLGADFFHRHLLDADAASNTLSWRWVAGLQTRGKSYLPRRSNLEKYLDPEILSAHGGGLDQLQHPCALTLDEDAVDYLREITRPYLTTQTFDRNTRFGLLVHREDLSPETGPLRDTKPDSILVLDHRPSGEQAGDSMLKRSWIGAAQTDTLARLTTHYADAEVGLGDAEPIKRQIQAWCAAKNTNQCLAMRPEVGALADTLQSAFDALQDEITVCWVDRPTDLEVRQLATGGYFGFWKKFQKTLRNGFRDD